MGDIWRPSASGQQPLKGTVAPATPPLVQNAGGGWAQTSLLALPPDRCGEHRGRGTEDRGAAGRSQQWQPLQVILPGFVLKVSFGDTSTHVAIFICERGRIFLNGCNFWLFPYKKKKKFLIPIHVFLPLLLPLPHFCINTPMHTHTHTARQTLGSTTAILRLCG